MMHFGVVVQVILFKIGLFSAFRFKPVQNIQKDKVDYSILCFVGFANIIQIIMTLAVLCSFAGKVCAGDYLPEKLGKEYNSLLPYYE